MFSAAISKGLGSVELSSIIFRDVSNYLPVNTSPHITDARLSSRLHGVALECRDKRICFLYIHCCCCIHLLKTNHILFWITSYLQIVRYY